MPKAHSPRHGSLQVWPRVRAKRQYSRVRAWATSKDPKPLGFAGYKAGMTKVMIIDNRSNSTSKGQQIAMACTVIECPPLKVCGIVGYKKTTYGLKKTSQILSSNLDKILAKKIQLPKKQSKKELDVEKNDVFRILVHTQPKLTGLPKKKPELFELAIGGTKQDQYNFAKEKLGKEITPEDAFKEGEQVDIHAITRGKGFQGATKRNRTGLRSHKSEKGRRGPANLGAWTGNRSWTVAHPGQMGYHQRTKYNAWILKLGKDNINPKGDFVKFGKVKNTYLLLKGSVNGPKKRLITLTKAMRPSKKFPNKAPQINYISNASQQ